jgi:hypothetical protein
MIEEIHSIEEKKLLLVETMEACVLQGGRRVLVVVHRPRARLSRRAEAAELPAAVCLTCPAVAMTDRVWTHV